MLLIMLPSVKQILRQVFCFHVNKIDFLLAVTSNLCLIAGSLGMGMADSVPIFFLGTCTP